jgi:hypothetical protein
MHSKSAVLEALDREDRSYRLALLCSNWIRDAAHYTPSAAHEARGMSMEARGQWISFADIADKLEQPMAREAVSSDFVLNHLYTLIRTPFELLRAYCNDFDKGCPGHHLADSLRRTDWYSFARLIRNAVSHNFHFDFTARDMGMMPITWNGITLTADMHGRPLTYEAFWHKPGYELFLQMRSFAETLPEAAGVPGEAGGSSPSVS